MPGLDASFPVVLLAAVLLGLRHAADPDHVAAMATLVARAPARGGHAAGMLGLAWGLGHATTVVLVGVPLLVLGAHLPGWLQQTAEAAVGLVIVVLSVQLIRRSRAERLHLHEHDHPDGVRHTHLHAHCRGASHAHLHAGRTHRGAFGIGLLHGLAGSGAVAVLLLAAIESTPLALAALMLFGAASAVAMAVASTGFGLTLMRARGRRTWARAEPLLGCMTLAFGLLYAAGTARLLG